VFNRRGDLIGVITSTEMIPATKEEIGFPMWGLAEYVPKEVIYEVERRE